MRESTLGLIIGAVVIICGLALLIAATRTRGGLHAAPRGGDVLDLGPRPADRFTPGVVVPFTPQLGEPLKELPEREKAAGASGPDHGSPEVGVDAAASPDGGMAAAGNDPGGSRPPSHPLLHVASEIDALIDEVRQRFNPRPGDQPKPRPPHATDGQTTGEIFEHLCEGPGCWCQPWTPTPDAPPAEVVEGLNGHYTVDAAVESMFTRAQAEQVRALANGQVSDG